MRTLLRILMVSAIAAFLAAPAVRMAQASEAVPASVFHDNRVQAGDSITLSGTIDGDAILFGNRVAIPKDVTITGDLLVAANELVVEGRVQGSIRAAASTADLRGTVDRNITILASTVRFAGTSNITGTTALLAQGVDLRGSFGRSVTIRSERVQLGGNFHQNVDLHLGNSEASTLTVSGPVKIEGDLTYRSRTSADIPAGSILGRTDFQQIAGATVAESFRAAVSFARVLRFIGLLLLGLLLQWLFPQLFPALARNLRTSGGRGVLLGVGLFLGLPIVMVLLAVTVIGLPIALALLAAYGMVFVLAKLAVGALLGGALAERFRWKLGPAGILALGFAVLELVLSVLLHLGSGSFGTILGFAAGVLDLFLTVWVFGTAGTLLLRAVRSGRPAKPAP